MEMRLIILHSTSFVSTYSHLLNRVSNAFEVEYKVRNYEVDQYRVVHNACYACYCQQAREEFLESIGVFVEETAESGKSVALAESNLKFLAPLRSGDRFVVSVKVSGLTAARLFFESLIYKLPNDEC
uniref:Uncharacterized protein aq_1494 n=1 Tax=Anthurium amnicola TaxID=1678845 RepID=A0A1D1YC92_9ARAE